MSLRLFIAADIPVEALKGLVSWQQEFLASDPAVRITPAKQLHITLVFLGQKGEKERDFAIGLMEAIRDRSSIEAVATGIVGLPKGRNPRIIAAEIEEPAGRLKAIHDELATGLADNAYYKSEKRAFFPHVTIARARGGTCLDLSEIHPGQVKFTAVRITLYNSILKAKGAEHVALKSVQLN